MTKEALRFSLGGGTGWGGGFATLEARLRPQSGSLQIPSINMLLNKYMHGMCSSNPFFMPKAAHPKNINLGGMYILVPLYFNLRPQLPLRGLASPLLQIPVTGAFTDHLQRND